MNFAAWQAVLLPHVSEERLTRLASQDFGRPSDALAQRHIARCPRCYARYGRLARTLLRIARHREDIIKRLGPLPPTYRRAFVREIDSCLESLPAQPRYQRKELPAPAHRRFSRSLANALALPIAALVLCTLWHLRVSTLSANELIDRAVASEHGSNNPTGAGLIRKRIRIRAGQKTIDRSVYLDISSRRPTKIANIGATDKDLAARLALAGVNWDDPLSALSFKTWHDSQTHPRDRVYSSGPGFLTMSTELRSPFVVRESLTVTSQTFRPVERTVEYRRLGTVDIAEIGSDVFVPAEQRPPFAGLFTASEAAEAPTSPRNPLPTAAQLNEAELRARLILNQQHADTGEEIAIRRDPQGVHVEGLVESEQRKQVLNQSLQNVPLLSAAVQSFDDLKSLPAPAAPPAPSEQRTMVAGISPLQRYFLQQGRSPDDLSRISAGLLDQSLAISRSSRSIDQLFSRFLTGEDMTSAAVHTRDELLSRLKTELLNDLSLQQRLLGEANILLDSPTIESPLPDVTDTSLAKLADRNLALTKELVSGLDASTRSGQSIAIDLAETIRKLRSASNKLDAVLQN